MNNEVKQDAPAGLVRKLTTRWGLNGPNIDEVDTNTQAPTTTYGSRGVKPRKNSAYLNNNFFKQILCRNHGELEVAGFTVKQEREAGPNQTSNIMSVDVLTTDICHTNVILKSLNSSPDAKVRT